MANELEATASDLRSQTRNYLLYLLGRREYCRSELHRKASSRFTNPQSPFFTRKNQSTKTQGTKVQSAKKHRANKTVTASSHSSLDPVLDPVPEPTLSRDDIGLIIESVLDELVADGWLNNERYTESYIRTQMQKGYGPLRIFQELESKGVSGSIVSRVEQSMGIDWQQQLEEQVVGKLAKLNLASGSNLDYKEKSRMVRYFQYRGYALSAILSCLE